MWISPAASRETTRIMLRAAEFTEQILLITNMFPHGNAHLHIMREKRKNKYGFPASVS